MTVARLNSRIRNDSACLGVINDFVFFCGSISFSIELLTYLSTVDNMWTQQMKTPKVTLSTSTTYTYLNILQEIEGRKMNSNFRSMSVSYLLSTWTSDFFLSYNRVMKYYKFEPDLLSTLPIRIQYCSWEFRAVLLKEKQIIPSYARTTGQR